LAYSGGRRALIRDYKEYHTDNSVHFVVSLTEAAMKRAEEIGLEKVFKLQTTLSTNSMPPCCCCGPLILADMHLFGIDGAMRRFTSPHDIISYHFPVRIEFYQKRKAHMLGRLRADVLRLQNHTRFLQLVCDGGVFCAVLLAHCRCRQA
jgi:DNA topoisomerase-2